MILRQFLHANPVGISYLFGCGGKAAGAVVDPVGDIAPIFRPPKRRGCASSTSSTRTFTPTTCRRDGALADAAGAEYVLFAGAEASPEFHGVRDGDVLAARQRDR